MRSKLVEFENSNQIVMTQNRQLIRENQLLWDELLKNK